MSSAVRTWNSVLIVSRYIPIVLSMIVSNLINKESKSIVFKFKFYSIAMVVNICGFYLWTINRDCVASFCNCVRPVKVYCNVEIV